jgi:muramoyltetrapeptide carboxypeptidase
MHSLYLPGDNPHPVMPTCYVTCPSWALEGPEDRARIVARAARGAAVLGCRPVYSPLLESFTEPESWLDPETRSADLDLAFRHDVMWSARGGHGAIHLLPHLLTSEHRKAPLMIAYSDGTALHACWRARQWGESWYGSLLSVQQSGRGYDSFARLARGEGFVRNRTRDPSVRGVRPGRARGTLFAGCLSVIGWLTGTPVARPFEGCILAIEDLEITPFTADYCLHQLYQAGLLEGVAGLIGGGFTDMLNTRTPIVVRDLIEEWAERLGVPALTDFPFGHLDDALFLPNGREVELNVGSDGSWELIVPDYRGELTWLARKP